MDIDPQKQIIQMEMDKFGMEKELSKLKSRLIERELSWPQYRSFKTQLLQGKQEREYFSDMNAKIGSLKAWSELQRKKEIHHKQVKHHFFFAGMLFFLIVTLGVGWYQGWAGVQGFTIKQFAEPNVFLDKSLYQVGEPVYIHVLPKDTPYMLTIIDEESEWTPRIDIFTPDHKGAYTIQVVIEWHGELKTFEKSLQVE